MIFNFWSIVLVASASQCVFLILLLLTRPSANSRAKKLLISLLGVLLLITVNNLVYAGRIYYTYPMIAGLGRGMSLLVGPLIYLYTKAIIDKGFRYHWQHWLHAIPYLIVLLILYLPGGEPTEDIGIALVDNFMTTGIPTTPASIVRFSIYVIQLLIYVLLARSIVRKTTESEDLQISVNRRKRWILIVNLFLLSACLVLIVSISGALITGLYGYQANFWLTIVYSVFIYLIAYRAVANAKELFPDFNKNYGSINLDKKKSVLLPDLLALFEAEKVFLNPDLKLADVANQLDTPPHVLTSLINRELGKTFFELLNEYRVKEFIERSGNPDFAHLSIMGVAQEVGYKSKSSFNTAFKKQTGQTPSEYLKDSQN